MKQPVNIQDQFLNTLRREKIPVTVFLLNGFQLRGHVKAFDNFTVVLDSDGKQQLIYKHAISTFAPQRQVSLQVEAESTDSGTEK
ncbi:RNA chaperone Hfq [Salibacterium qingdaonense]|uniref:RNA-binding protein Hfq n=1 Tax=Salibacterium qingdaonense TaxID=266892 RepID=A0A1I4K8S5_9BACI|nr:RNA chaperone Hfq [Salibacterium qingdaonense]SFL74896.1 host factor-I protein [Salibacterium qingdaonense]